MVCIQSIFPVHLLGRARAMVLYIQSSVMPIFLKSDVKHIIIYSQMIVVGGIYFSQYGQNTCLINGV